MVVSGLSEAFALKASEEINYKVPPCLPELLKDRREQRNGKLVILQEGLWDRVRKWEADEMTNGDRQTDSPLIIFDEWLISQKSK